MAQHKRVHVHAALRAAQYTALLQDMIEQARLSGVVLTIDRVPEKAMNGKHKSVAHARPARGYY